MASKLRRGGRLLLSVALLASLVSAAALWVVATRPYDPAQHEAPAVDVAATGFPVYNDAVLVLNYHDVAASSTSPYTVTSKAFAAQLDALRKAGFHSIRLADLQALVAGRPVRLPARPILLTFDDGPASNWLDADPVLQRYGFSAVAFLISAKIAQPYQPSYHLSTEQVRRMASTGRWEFGGHTDDLHRKALTSDGSERPALVNRLMVGGHQETLAQWRARVAADLARNQGFFVKVLGRRSSAFAFPYGAADRPTNDPAIPGQLNRLLRQAGFQVGFGGDDLNRNSGALEVPVTPGADAYRLPRVTITGDLDPVGLLDALRKAAPDPVAADLTTLHWAGDSTGCTVDRMAGRPPALSLRSAGYGRCAAPVNPVQWSDYRFAADVVGVERGATAFVGVRARLTPGSRGRAEVVLGESVVRVREQIGSRVRVLAVRKLRPGHDHQVEITVVDDRITVRVDDLEPIAARLDPALATGAVDFGIAAQGSRTLTFLGPHLVDLRKPPRQP
jgi:poly-beta-1,6-N-acetyl-D-glucosamine N-deacetylase